MLKIFIKVLLSLLILNSVALGAVEEKVILCNQMDAKYDEKVYRKVTILLTEARLKLQKKYKKYLSFEYQDKLIEDKAAIKKELKKQGARYYVYLEIKDTSKGKCKNKKCKADYTIKIYDAKKNKNLKVKIKVFINNNEFTEIKVGYMKSSTKKIVKFLKSR